MRAIDKDLNTTTGVETNGEYGWWQAELDKARFIHKIVVYHQFYTNSFQTGFCFDTVAGFEACVEDRNNVDVSVYQGDVLQKSCGTLQLTNLLYDSYEIYTLLCNIGGDTVKLSKTTGNIVISEVVIIGRG